MLTPEQELLRAIEFLERLDDNGEKELREQMHKSPEQYGQLLIVIGSLTTKLGGSLNKLYELVTALELASKYDKEVYEVCHVTNTYGADIVIKNKETHTEERLEVKHSMCKKSTGYKTSWDFSVDTRVLLAYKDSRDDMLLVKLVKSIYDKQKDGVSIFTARDGRTQLAQYKVSAAFVSIYCMKKLITATCSVVNLGCQQCPNCKGYHRIIHLFKWGEELERRIIARGMAFDYTLTWFTTAEWVSIFKRQASKC